MKPLFLHCVIGMERILMKGNSGIKGLAQSFIGCFGPSKCSPKRALGSPLGRSSPTLVVDSRSAY